MSCIKVLFTLLWDVKCKEVNSVLSHIAGYYGLLSHGPLSLAMCTCVYACRACSLIGRSVPMTCALHNLHAGVDAFAAAETRDGCGLTHFQRTEDMNVHVGAGQRCCQSNVQNAPSFVA